MTNRKTKSQATTEVNFMRREICLEIVRAIMITTTNKSMEIMVMILFLLTTWCERILTTIFSYQTYQITTMVNIIWSEVCRSSFRLILNSLCLPVVCRWNNSACILRIQKTFLVALSWRQFWRYQVGKYCCSRYGMNLWSYDLHDNRALSPWGIWSLF